MSLSTDSVLFGIALVVFGTWLEVSGLGGWPFAVAGLGLGATGFLGSVGSSMRSAPVPVDDDES
jgi:hypothetical protein